MTMGKLTDQPATAAEAAKMGGIDFTVSECPVYFRAKSSDKYVRVDERKAIVRDDTGDWLSFTSKNYPVLQYSEAFDFMDTVSPHFVAAGSLRKGRQAFMVVKADTIDLQALGIEDHEMFMVLRTSHDCSRAVEIMIMPLRGRCMNQLTLRSFRKGVAHRWSITHTGDVKKKLQDAENSIMRAEHYANAYAANVKQLVEKKISDEVAHQILLQVLPNRPKRPEVIETIVTNWHNRETIGFSGQGWGLVNAVSEYFEWDRTGGSPESRFLAALQGQTHQVINRVTSHLLTRS